MKKIALLFTFLVIISCIAVGVYIYKPYPLFKTELLVSSRFNPVKLEDESKIHFCKDGFIVYGNNLDFYDWNGNKSDLSLLDENSTDKPFKIIFTTENIIATDNGMIFDTSSIPFKRIYNNSDIEILDIKDYGEFLLILAKGSQNNSVPYLLTKGGDFLLSIDGLGTTHYLDSDCHIYSKGLTIMALDTTKPLPETHVFHFSDMNQPYGLLSLVDTVMHDIYRLENKVILIGSSEVLCYNIDGGNKPVWKVDKAKSSSFQTIKTSDSLLIYFKDAYDDKEPNAVFIDREGRYELKHMHRFIDDLQVYKNGLVGLEYDNTIVLMDKRGKVLSKNRLKYSIESIYTTSYNPKAIYAITKDKELIMFTTDKERDEQNK